MAVRFKKRDARITLEPQTEVLLSITCFRDVSRVMIGSRNYRIVVKETDTSWHFKSVAPDAAIDKVGAETQTHFLRMRTSRSRLCGRIRHELDALTTHKTYCEGLGDGARASDMATKDR